MWKLRIGVTLAICTAVLWPGEAGTASRGRELFEKRCTGCHSLDAPRVGPALRAVYGRRAAADPTFPYSDALKRTRLRWDDDTLNRWLADPDALVPDTDMAFRLTQAEERAAIIAYLQELAGKREGR